MVLFNMSWRSIIILHCFIYYVCGETNYTAALAARITNGRRGYHRHNFGAQVSLRIGNIHYCGGGIINEFHIITAAQCCFQKKKKSWFSNKIPAKSILAVAGDMKLHTKLSSHQERKIACVLPHEKFDKKTLTNDIALIRVKHSWLLNSNVKPLRRSVSPDGDLDDCFLAGWGSTNPSGEKLSEDLRWCYTYMTDPEDCVNTFGPQIKPGMFCADNLNDNQAPTDGDLGGAIMCDYDVYLGIASKPAGFISRALYTGAKFHSQWIEKTKQRPCPLELGIIAAIIGAVLLVLLAILIIFCLLKRKKEEDEEEGEEGEEGEGDEEGGEEDD